MKLINRTDSFRDSDIEKRLSILKDLYLSTDIDIIEANVYQGINYLRFELLIYDTSDKKYIRSSLEAWHHNPYEGYSIHNIFFNKLLPEYGISKLSFEISL